MSRTMDNREIYSLLLKLSNNFKSFRKMEQKLSKFFHDAEKMFLPRERLPVSIPLNIIFRSTKVTDVFTQTGEDAERALLDQSTTTNENSQIIDNDTLLCGEDTHLDSLPPTPILERIYEENTVDACDLPDLKKDLLNMAEQTTSTNNNKTSNHLLIAHEPEILSRRNTNNKTDLNKNADPKETNQNQQASVTYTTKINLNSVKQEIVDDECFKKLIKTTNEIMALLYKKVTKNKVATVKRFTDIIIAIFEMNLNETTKETAEKETTTEDQAEKDRINADIELKLTAMKREVKDDDDNLASELDMLTELERNTTNANETAINETAVNETAVYETVVNEAAVNKTAVYKAAVNKTAVNETMTYSMLSTPRAQLPINNCNGYDFDNSQCLYNTAQRQNANATNLRNRTPKLPPAPAQNVQPGYSGYYTNQESTNTNTNKNYRHSTNRSYSRQSSPYQRYPQQDRTPQASVQQATLNQQNYYLRYIQQHGHLPNQMYPQNLPYN